MSEFCKDKIKNIRGDHVQRYKFASGAVSGFVLDAGCGCGYGSKILRGGAAKVLGVDKSREAVQYAREYYSEVNISFLVGDITTITVADVPFDFDHIVAFEFIEHLKDPGPVLKNMALMAKSLTMSVPNQENRPYDKAKFPYHFRHFSPQEIEDVLISVGWTDLKFYHQKDLTPGRIFTGTGGLTLIIKATREN